MRRLITVCIILVPVLFSIPAFLSFFDRPFYIFPSKLRYELGELNDSFGHGTSVVSRLSRDDVITCEYTLGEGYQFPDAGFYLRLSEGFDGIDVSGFDYVNIKIKTTASKSVVIYLKSVIPGYTFFSDDSSFFPLQYELELSGDRIEYDIPLNRFIALPWWFRKNRSIDKTKLRVPYKNLYNFQVYNGNLPLHVKDTITVGSISFRKYFTALYGITLIAVIIYYASLFSVSLILKNLKKSGNNEHPAILSNRPFDRPSLSNNKELGLIVGSMRNDYSDPEYSIWDLREKTGYHNRKISKLIKDAYAMSFSQLLNEIRIREAQRLLKDTNLTATDIAFNIGYNNYTHFMREFKRYTGISAQKYRTNTKISGLMR
jgi:AraC-like DNA-binding protein